MLTPTAVMFVLGQWCWSQLQSCLYSASDDDAYCSHVYTRPVMLTPTESHVCTRPVLLKPTAVLFILGQWWWRLLQSCLYSASAVDTSCSPVYIRPMMEMPSAALLFLFLDGIDVCFGQWQWRMLQPCFCTKPPIFFLFYFFFTSTAVSCIAVVLVSTRFSFFSLMNMISREREREREKKKKKKTPWHDSLWNNTSPKSFVNDSILRNQTIQLVRQRQHFAEPHNTTGSSTTAFCGTTQYNRFVNDSILRNHTVQLVHQGGYLAEYINKTVSTWFVKHDSTLWNMTLVQLVRQRRHIVVQLIERHFV